MAKKFEIRNSTAEFLIFQIEGKEDGVQVMYRDKSIWCTQKAMAQLFDVGVPYPSAYTRYFHLGTQPAHHPPSPQSERSGTPPCYFVSQISSPLYLI